MHRAVQARSWPMQTPCAAHPGTRQVEACSRDKKCDTHRRISRKSITEGFMARSRRPGRPRKTGARRTTRRKAATRKTAARKTGARKTAARKTIGRKTGARKTAGRKTAARKTAARKTIGRTSATRKALPVANRQPAGQQSERRQQVARWRLALQPLARQEGGRRWHAEPRTAGGAGHWRTARRYRRPRNQHRRSSRPRTCSDRNRRRKSCEPDLSRHS